MYVEYILPGNVRVNNFHTFNQVRKFGNNEKRQIMEPPLLTGYSFVAYSQHVCNILTEMADSQQKEASGKNPLGISKSSWGEILMKLWMYVLLVTLHVLNEG